MSVYFSTFWASKPAIIAMVVGKDAAQAPAALLRVRDGNCEAWESTIANGGKHYTRKEKFDFCIQF